MKCVYVKGRVSFPEASQLLMTSWVIGYNYECAVQLLLQDFILVRSPYPYLIRYSIP